MLTSTDTCVLLFNHLSVCWLKKAMYNIWAKKVCPMLMFYLFQDTWNVKYQKYINEGMTEDQAGEKANTKTLWAVKRNFFARFKDFLLNYLRLKDDNTYQEISSDIEENNLNFTQSNNNYVYVNSKLQSSSALGPTIRNTPRTIHCSWGEFDTPLRQLC